jgi:acyl-CoA synthetase (NDP forming)
VHPPDRADLKAFFEPRAVAAVGSLREVPGTAYWVIKNMRHFGFSGPIHPINPDPSAYGEVFGSPVRSSVLDVDGPIDLAVVITPPPTVPKIVEQCVQKGIEAVIVLSEGFAEASEQGATIQRKLEDIVHRTKIRIVGPNTFGVFNAANGLATMPPYADQERVQKGGIAFLSQTGSIGPHQVPLLDWGYPISKICDIGNKCDVDEADMLHYLSDDPETAVVALHLEDIRDGPRFMDAARRLTARKPLVVLKAGRSEAGANASASHTGSLAGKDPVYDAALRQVGAIRVTTWHELWEVPKTLMYQPLPKGPRFAIITFTGGQGVIAADAATHAGLELAAFSSDTVRQLSRISSRLGRNPVDIGPVMSDSRSQSSANPFSALERTMPLVFRDENVHSMTITFYAGQQLVPMFPVVVDMIEAAARGVSKPLNVWIYGTSLHAMEELVRQLHARAFPAYLDLDTAIKSLGYAATYSRIRAKLSQEGIDPCRSQ